MNKLKMFTPVIILMGLSSAANADSSYLAYDDFVGMTFWLISMGMLAATVFFFYRKRFSRYWMENTSNSSWSNHWYCFYELYVCERYLDSNWRIANCIQIY